MTDQTPPAAPQPEPQRGLQLIDHLEPAEARAMALGDVFARSGMFGDARQQAAAAVRIMLGQAIGLPPVVAMAQVAVVDGKPSVGATAVGALLRNHGYDFRTLQLDDERCVVRFWRGRADAQGSEQLVPDVEFSLEDARRAELLDKKNWQRYPRAMMFARCMTAGARLHAPEVSAGLPLYDPDELRDARAGGDVVIDVPAAPVAATPAGPVTPAPPVVPEPADADVVPEPEPAIAAENAAKVAAQPTPPPEPRRRATADDDADAPADVRELLKLGRDELRDAVKSAGLSPSGTKRDLADRLAEHRRGAGAQPEPPEHVDAEVVDEPAPPIDDGAAIVQRARAELTQLGWREHPNGSWSPPAGEDDRPLTGGELDALEALEAEVAEPEPVDAGAEREPSDDELAAAERMAAEHPDLAAMPDVAAAEPEPGDGTEPLVSVEQRRQLFAKFREHELHDEAAQRALIEWVTSQALTDRLTAAQADELIDLVPYWKQQLAALARAASTGDERAHGIYVRHLDPAAQG